MSEKLNLKLKRATNIINDVCEFVVAEAPKITRNSCNKFNTFLTPCPVVASATAAAALPPFQRPPSTIVKAKFVGISGDIVGIAGSVNNMNDAETSSGSNFLSQFNISSARSGLFGDVNDGYDEFDEENQLNRQLQHFAAARIAVETDKGLNVKQHYFVSKFDRSTQVIDNKCQYFDASHLR